MRCWTIHKKDPPGRQPRGGVVRYFFQAEHGIREIGVTGVQTCALPIYVWQRLEPGAAHAYPGPDAMRDDLAIVEASLREHRGGRIARRSLARLRRQVDLFGFHMAR